MEIPDCSGMTLKKELIKETRLPQANFLALTIMKTKFDMIEVRCEYGDLT